MLLCLMPPFMGHFQGGGIQGVCCMCSVPYDKITHPDFTYTPIKLGFPARARIFLFVTKSRLVHLHAPSVEVKNV
jgi:hypothetical protein